MATNTTNYNLSKPAYTDTADIAVINSNMDKIDTELKNKDVLIVDMGTISSLPVTKTQSNIAAIANVTSDMIVVRAYLDTPHAQHGEWTVTTGNKSITVSGEINPNASTNLKLYLMKFR